LFVLAAAPSGWLATEMHARQQRQAAMAIRALGGLVLYDYELMWPACTILACPRPHLLHALLGEDFFARVLVVESSDEITDEA
jgi:hypothetical protein